MKSELGACAFAALFTTAAFAQPKIFVTFTGAAAVQNNYSYILPGMPSYGIAQGSIFASMGPASPRRQATCKVFLCPPC